MELDGLAHQLDRFLARLTGRETTRQVEHVSAEAGCGWLNKD